MSKYPTYQAQEDGFSEWVRPVTDKPFRFSCCDCGLVHDLEFAVDPDDGFVNFRARRNNRATGQIRRHRGITVRHE